MSSGSPAGWQTPLSLGHSPGGQGISGGSPAGWQLPSSRSHSPGAHSSGPGSSTGATGTGSSPLPQPPNTPRKPTARATHPSAVTYRAPTQRRAFIKSRSFPIQAAQWTGAA